MHSARARLVIVLSLACEASAHDFWIEPSTFRPQSGAVVEIGLRVGEHFKGDPVRRNPDKIERFVLVGPAEEKPVVGREGADPAGLVRLETPGVYIVGFRSKTSSIEMEPGKFENYLREEGLEQIVKARAERGENQKPGREVYSRCAKAILKVGGESRGYDRPLHFRLELIPEKDPCRWPEEGELPLRVEFDDKPLAGLMVVAMQRDEPEHTIAVRSDEHGRATFRLQGSGVWLVKAVHMVRLEDGRDADWESLWASLTFEMAK